jgi:sporulation integral membrane protein YtvI
VLILGNELKLVLWGVVIGLGLIWGFQYLFPLLTPFLVGILLACMIEPIVKQAEIGLKLKRKIAVLLILIVTLVGLLSLTGIVFFAAYQETLRVSPKIPLLVNKLIGVGSGLACFLREYFQIPETFLQNYLLRPDAVEQLIRSFVLWIINLAPVFPRVIMVLGLGGITAYFISRDKKFFSGLFQKIIPLSWRPFTIQVKEEVVAAFISFIHAEILLAFLTASLTALIFWILKIPGAVVYGFLAGILDFIPVVGPGMLYLPLMIVFCLFQKYYQAIWLIILYFILLFLRQMGEVKLVGENLQIHPLVGIFLVYLGMKFFGLIGILLTPIIVILIRAIFRGLKFKQVREFVNYNKVKITR